MTTMAPTTAGISQGRVTGWAGRPEAPGPGKVMVALVSRWMVPLVSFRCACHGPVGSRGSSRTVAGALLPGERVVLVATRNGTALVDAGPSDRETVPLMSRVRAPVLLT